MLHLCSSRSQTNVNSIWMAKFTVSEFLKRMTERFWKKGYELGLRGIRIFLVATFVAVLIATLSECHPFPENWQVVPEAKPTCRQGYGHLLTMGTTDIVTDLLLVLFPIPIILRSSMTIKRKLQLVALFSMSLVLVIITAARIPLVIGKSGLQQFRTVWASSEILAATGVSNAIILGSFLRDRGIKKSKYKPGSVTDSMERRSSTRRTMQDGDSDEDLARSLGYRTNPDLADERPSISRPAPVVDINLLNPRAARGAPPPFSVPNWQASKTSGHSDYSADSDPKGRDSEDPAPSPRAMGGRRVSFFDVGGLLENGPVTAPSPTDSVVAQDFAPQPRRPSRSSLAPSARSYMPGRRPSRLSQQSQEYELTTRSVPQLHDTGNLLAEKDKSAAQRRTATPSESDSRAPTGMSTRPLLARDTPTPLLRSPTATSYASVPSLQDAGGLLS